MFSVLSAHVTTTLVLFKLVNLGTPSPIPIGKQVVDLQLKVVLVNVVFLFHNKCLELKVFDYQYCRDIKDK